MSGDAGSGLTAASRLSAAMQAINTGSSTSRTSTVHAGGGYGSAGETTALDLPLTQSQHHVDEHHEHQQSADGSTQLTAAAR